MEKSLLNDEEKVIMDDLEGLPEPEKIEILKDSLSAESEPSGQRVLRALLLKLETGRRPTSS